MDRSFFLDSFEKRYGKDFEELEKIGRGGYASVYRVRNRFDDNLYAVKKIRLRVKDIRTNFEEEIAKVLREAKYLAQLNHPNVIRYYNCWIETLRHEDKDVRSKKTGQKGVSGLNSLKTQPKPQEHNKLLAHTQDHHSNYLDFADFHLEVHDEDNQDGILLWDLGGEPDKDGGLENPCEEMPPPPKFHKEHSAALTQSPNRSTSTSSMLDDIKFVTVYLQMEVCQKSLEQYLCERNKRLEELRRQNIPEIYEAESTRYLAEAR
jgi:translation initiation factor 2-alpha kinase 1